MAINFPDSPSNGDTFTANGKTFVYNSTNTSWRPQSAAEGGRADVLANMAALVAKTGMVAGDTALVTALNKMFVYTASGWFLIATIQNNAPSTITGVDGSYTLAADGTATVVTVVSTDPEGFPLTFSHAVTTGSLGSIATVAQGTGANTNVFTITPSTDSANVGNFSLTFSVTDGSTGAVNAISAFSLSFNVENSRYTALSVKATATGSNKTFDDASTSDHTITTTGNTTASTFSPYRHGGYSTYFDGTDDALTVPISADFAFDADFQVECWFYSTAHGSGAFNSLLGVNTTGNTDWGFYIQAAGTFFLYDPDIGGSKTYANAFNYNTWNFVSWSRSGGTVNFHINGIRIDQYASSGTVPANGPLWIGSDDPVANGDYNGYVRDVRIVKGSTIYSASNYTPPTDPLTAITNTKFLLGQLPYFKDQSTSNHTITVVGNASLKPKSVFDNAPYSEASHGASTYFDGTGDYLSIPSSTDFALGTGDFTVDFWVYQQEVKNFTIYFDYRTTANQNTLYLYGTSSATMDLHINGVGHAFTPPNMLNKWTHIAIARSGNLTKLFIDGVQYLSFIDNTDYVQGGTFYIGRYYSSDTYNFNGYMCDFRWVKGTALYTSAFTPPTSPLTAITNTKFLLNPETSISDLSQRNAVKCIGNTTTSTSYVKFAGTISIYMATTGDYLQLVDPLDSWISTYGGDYTIELWWYPTDVTTGTYQEFLTCSAGFQWYTESNGQIRIALSGNNSGSFFWHPSAMYQMVSNTWHHLALVRQGTNYTVYVDGVSKATIANAPDINTGTNALELGSYAGGQHPSSGYYQDFRITKGLARYTGNFTPPTAESEG